MQLFSIICHRSKFQKVISLLGVHAKGQWTLTQGDSLGSREDFQRIPELAINPLGDRIINAFFPEGWVPAVIWLPFWGWSGIMMLVGSSQTTILLIILNIPNMVISKIYLFFYPLPFLNFKQVYKPIFKILFLIPVYLFF